LIDKAFFGLIPLFYFLLMITSPIFLHYSNHCCCWRHYFTAIKNRTTSTCSQSSAYYAKTCEGMLRHRAVYWDDCAAIW